MDGSEGRAFGGCTEVDYGPMIPVTDNAITGVRVHGWLWAVWRDKRGRAVECGGQCRPTRQNRAMTKRRLEWNVPSSAVGVHWSLRAKKYKKYYLVWFFVENVSCKQVSDVFFRNNTIVFIDFYFVILHYIYDYYTFNCLIYSKTTDFCVWFLRFLKMYSIV